MATTFFADSCLTIVAYLTPKVYKFVTFDTMSNGKSTFISNDDALTDAIIRTTEFKNGLIKSDKPVKSVVKENFTTESTNKESVAPETKDIPETPSEETTTEETTPETEDKTFADVAEAKAFLVEKGVKASEIRSLKAIKEKGAELGYNITIED